MKNNKHEKVNRLLCRAGMMLCSGMLLAGCSRKENTAQTEKVQVQSGTEVQTEAEIQTEAALQTEIAAQTQAVQSESETDAHEDREQVYVRLSGGSGRASIANPTELTQQNDVSYAKIVWSSNHYDYMIVDGRKYLNEATDGNSTFTIPIAQWDTPLTMIADTTAMSTPHEIEYELTFSMEPFAETEQEAEDDNAKQQAAKQEMAETAAAGQETENDPDDAVWDQMEPTASMQLQYANQFQVDFYDDMTLLQSGDQKIFIVPDDQDLPEGIPEDVIVLQGYPQNTYLVSSSAMDLVRAAGALEHVRFCGTKQSDWYIQEAIDAMERGDLLYAGKYNAPDYEMLIAGACDLAVENTMIGHNPQVQEKMENIGIPVMVERSSYETHPLGRLEWVRFYGALFGEVEQADAYYQEQLDQIDPVLKQESTKKSAAFFSINSSGAANIRKPGDYISKSIELAGGEYVFSDLVDDADNALSSMNMQMEDFYAGARDADVLIYNSTIEGELDSLAELLEKSALFSDFAALKNGYVFCANRNLFQQTTGTAAFITDLHTVLQAASQGVPVNQQDLTYLSILQ